MDGLAHSLLAHCPAFTTSPWLKAAIKSHGGTKNFVLISEI